MMPLSYEVMVLQAWFKGSKTVEKSKIQKLNFILFFFKVQNILMYGLNSNCSFLSTILCSTKKMQMLCSRTVGI